jgi:hypothetical protein
MRKVDLSCQLHYDFHGTMATAGEVEDATVGHGELGQETAHGHQAEPWDTRHISS